MKVSFLRITFAESQIFVVIRYFVSQISYLPDYVRLVAFGHDAKIVSGPDAQIFNEAAELAKLSGARLAVTDRVEDIVGFDVAYTDTWVSMGDNTPLEAVKDRFMPYQINQGLLD